MAVNDVLAGVHANDQILPALEAAVTSGQTAQHELADVQKLRGALQQRLAAIEANAGSTNEPMEDTAPLPYWSSSI